MAVPTISSVTPSTVAPASEEMVKIEGTGYNVPAIPVSAAQYPGVRVWVDGRQSDLVLNVTTGILYVRVPRYLGEPEALPKSASIRIANVNAAGGIIAGEDVTFPSKITYATEAARIPAAEPFFMIAIREVIKELRRQVALPVVFAATPDWQDEIRLEYYEAEVPSVGIRGLTFRNYPYIDKYGRVEVSAGTVPDSAALYQDKEETEIVLEAILVASTKDELLRYYHSVRLFGQRTGRVYVPKAEGSTERVAVRMTLDLSAEVGFNTREVLASATFSMVLGPVPIEAPEVLNRAWENLIIAVDARNAL